MNRTFNRRGLRATLTLVAAGAATLAGGSALAATHASSQTAAACVAKASTPVRVGHISGIAPAAPASAACQAANSDSRVLRSIKNAGDKAEGVPPLIWHGGAVMGTSQTGPWS